MPAAKYSLSGSRLKFANGKTAIDFSGTVAASLGRGVDVDFERKSRYTNNPAATTASAIVTATIFRPVRRAIDLFGSISDSSLIPSGVISKAHEKISATGKPKMMTMINTFIAHDGASKAGKKIDAAWIRSQATTM